MLTPQYILPIHSELVVDLFAGGGGASTGIEQAIGHPVDIAINHDPEAISLHESNHPQTRHYCSDVFEVDPVAVTHGRPVGLLWASPDCKHFSKAKGGRPVSKKIRSLAWVVVRWAKAVRPRVICLENVEEFQTWGPLDKNNKPCPDRKGETFQRWIASLQNLGYRAEWRELRACDYGAPTIRKRLFIVARRDGLPIRWPVATHGNPDRAETRAQGLILWRTAAECIDWSLPVQSIFGRKRPLADATLKRIARGVVKYVIEAREPFIASLAHGEESPSGVKRWGSGVRSIHAPLQTVLAGGNGAALVAAFLAKHYGGVVGSEMGKPIGTITSVDHHSLTTAYVSKMRGDNIGHSANDPLHTISAGGTHHAAVAALLVKYYGNERDGISLTEPMHTIPTRDRFGLVTVQVNGEPYVITDIGMRMLQPHELYAAQGFPADYRINKGADGKSLSKTAQVRMCGNSVCPPLAKALVEENYAMHEQRKAA